MPDIFDNYLKHNAKFSDIKKDEKHSTHLRPTCRCLHNDSLQPLLWRLGNLFQDTTGLWLYVIGLSSDDTTLIGYAGMINPESIDPVSITGTATFEGASEGLFIDNISENTTFSIVEDFYIPIEITANLNTGTFTGQNDPDVFFFSNDKQLTMNGSINNGELSGSVRMTGFGFGGAVSGTLDGKMGDTLAIGAIHGANDEDMFTGGFRVTR